MIQKQSLIDLLPKQYHLPLRFHYWEIRGKHEREIFFLKELVSSRKRAIDIGANVGTYSYALSKLYKVVEVFEPQSWCADTILAYSKSRRSNINVYNVGLSESNGSLNLHIPIKSGRYLYYLASFRQLEGETKRITVPVHRLDDYNFTDVSFIKIDVEGYESQVIRGGQETILREKPVLLVEIEQRHLGSKPIQKVFQEIIDLHYEGSFLYKGKLHPLSEFSYEIHQKQFLDSTFSKVFGNKINRNYINNFVFKPI
ncbi:MAG: FkbM family methyltransferase [Symplocastrum torsivum CPER-KK1]|jgi:FkbM family methyltransferase|uniref:FkbM family methyltransferase n=1 Tax=Symplocastrum torsivum CPER-KK1 TaxID=450513 RepID=A0A951PS12_9CYAN|nr:FkbM family methyltransferase [Symplocastrum torsivum CPER-KK1]